MDLNVTSVWCVAREAARRLIKAGADVSPRGRIVNIASMAGRIIIPNVSAYNASKAGCAHLTRSLAREWARYEINVNGLSPGYVGSELTADWLHGDGGQKYLQIPAPPRDGRDLAGRSAAVPVLGRFEVRDGHGRAGG